MKIYIHLLVITLLSACASPAQMRQENPFLHLKSTKSSKDVAICVSSKWENLGILRTAVPVNMRLTENGYTLTVFNTAISQTDYLLDIVNVGNGSESKYYKRINALGEPFDNAVKNCQ